MRTPAASAAATTVADPSLRTRRVSCHAAMRMNWSVDGMELARFTTAS
jgi:hypothetical protein